MTHETSCPALQGGRRERRPAHHRPAAHNRGCGRVISDMKMPATTAVAERFKGIERDEFELHVGITNNAYQALRESSNAAVRAVKAATRRLTVEETHP